MASLSQLKERTIHDTVAWKLFATEVGRAQMIEARWSVSEKGKLVDKYILHVREPGMVRLEVVGKSVTVWNGSAGIWIDNSMRVHMPLVVKPEFGEAAYFEFPALRKGKWNTCTYNLKEATSESGGRLFNVVSVTNHLVDAMTNYTYTFGAQSRLLTSMGVEYRGMWGGGEKDFLYAVELLDLFAMVDESLFGLKPPAGYTGIGS
ncbi:MAG: hypothetical protein WD716_11615 [Fimbriimonadaceae bacterium]